MTYIHIIVEKDKITAKILSENMMLEANTSGKRLSTPHNKRPVKRTDEIMDGGRIHAYECL